nr:GNAT family N-acetyltransferase [Variovorax boronicumulans]
MHQHFADTEGQVEFTSSFARARSLAASSLACSSTPSELFETLDWFGHLAACGFAEPVDVVLLCAWSPQRGRALVVPMAQRRGHPGLRSLSNYYSSLFGAVGDVDDAGLWLLAARALRGHAHGAMLDFMPLARDAAFVTQAQSALRNVGYAIGSYHAFGNWYLPCAGLSYEDYVQSLPSKLRNLLSRAQRRLARTGNAQLTIHTGPPGPELEQAIADFTQVYASSWKQPEPCEDFVPGLVRLAATAGWLRLGILHVAGKPVAAQLWMVVGGKANIYKLAYVQGFERLSPGTVLTAALMARVLDVDRVAEVDYLTGDDAYKRDWMRERRERIGLLAFDLKRWHGLAGAARHFGAGVLRRLRPRPD